jgi:hypothetical protein
MRQRRDAGEDFRLLATIGGYVIAFNTSGGRVETGDT